MRDGGKLERNHGGVDHTGLHWRVITVGGGEGENGDRELMGQKE